MIEEEEWWRRKGFYNGIMIIAFYAVLIVLLIYMMISPREYEVIEGVVHVEPLFELDQIVWGMIMLAMFFLALYALMERNARIIMSEFAHMEIIKGPLQSRKKAGEILDLWIDEMTEFRNLPRLSQDEIIQFIKNVVKKINLRSFNNEERLRQLFSLSEEKREHYDLFIYEKVEVLEEKYEKMQEQEKALEDKRKSLEVEVD